MPVLLAGLRRVRKLVAIRMIMSNNGYNHVRVLAAILSLVFFGLVSYAVEVTSQTTDVATSAQVWPGVMTGALANDTYSAGSPKIGDVRLEAESLAQFESVSVASRSHIELLRTNTVSGEVFRIQSDLRIQSHGDRLTVTQHLITKAFANSHLVFRFKTDKPFAYDLEVPSQTPPVLPHLGVLIIRGNGHLFVQMTWNGTSDGERESHGTLPAGEYEVDFSSNVTGEGAIMPILENPIDITIWTAVALTITPRDTPLVSRPALQVRREGTDRILLEMTNLEPGKLYFVERRPALTSEPDAFVAGFSAGGTNAVLIEPINPNAPQAFYRLKY
jgi:hypothetical protein